MFAGLGPPAASAGSTPTLAILCGSSPTLSLPLPTEYCPIIKGLKTPSEISFKKNDVISMEVE